MLAGTDQLRRSRGVLLERAGFGPRRSELREAWQANGVRLWAASDGGRGPPVLLLPAPIKACYLWDLAPAYSVVRRCLEAGLRPYLLEWPQPDRPMPCADFSQYAGGWTLPAVEAIAEETGRDPVVVGHSLGGTLAAMLAARHPDRVAALVLLEAPIQFGSGRLERFLKLGSAAPWLRAGQDPVPGSLLTLLSAQAAPDVFRWHPLLDFWAVRDEPRRLETYLRVLRWALDERSMPAALFDAVVEQLYRRDLFLRGELVLEGRRLDPAAVRCPLLAIGDPDSPLVPPSSMQAFLARAGSRDARFWTWKPEPGVAVAHLGVLVGAEAHARLWPAILDWARILR